MLTREVTSHIARGVNERADRWMINPHSIRRQAYLDRILAAREKEKKGTTLFLY
jgi:hypothetical protein